MKILLWQTAYLGDVVLATPLIRSLRESFPSSHIAFVGRSFIRDLLKGFDIELITFDKGVWESFELLGRLRRERYDAAISPHVSARTALILYTSGIPIRVGFYRSELPWLYTHKVKHSWRMHEVDRNLQLLKPIGAKSFYRMPLLLVEEEEKRQVIQKFNLPKEFLLIAPFSNFRLKEWHLEGWLKLIGLIPLPVLIVGTQRDVERSRRLEGKNTINLVGKTSLRELMAMVSLSKVVIACDSSPIHIANALGIPAISIYTSTTPDYGFYPLIGHYLKPDLSCSPCSPNPKSCKTGTQACLSKVEAGEVWEKLKLLI
ncbi:MAG: glycosyltransferase family 9 protein [Aquificaceae bacterium]